MTHIDLVGQTFGRLTVLERLPNAKKNHKWLCRCECGKTTAVLGFCLRNGNTKSCGSHPHVGPVTHGKSTTRAYVAWDHMLQRCQNPKSPVYKFYGARGIAVCERWQQFEGFYADMGDPPDGLSLERKENNGGYNKANCRWATKIDQANNTRSNHRLTHNGMTLTIAQWSRQLGFKRGVIASRLVMGWDITRTLSTTPAPRA
ncbi:hypothetical protein UFOVP1670_55 [uncultured Caudovirales phage]|uniref:Uncharacterized protein n=1 Tax=uncultured Caudovirales phage TaxID=2100421 RepID=A0A6J5T8I2_9CAUD|nr:hypothetical protein UFOVP1670_55 [uncultured Caudovirales phage]